MIVVLAVFCITLASGTVATFKTGPFTVSVDLGVPCDHVNIAEPVSSEKINGDSSTDYNILMCGTFIAFARYDFPIFNSNRIRFTWINTTKNNLLMLGADKDTIAVFERKIDGKPGAVGSGYVPKSDSTLYVADFYVSNRTVGHISLADNDTLMVSFIKTIHITEAT